MDAPRGNERPWRPGLWSLGLATAYAASLGPERLAQGGLAPLAITALSAAFLGVPLAAAEWRAGALSGRAIAGTTALGELGAAIGLAWSVLLVAAAAAPHVAAAPTGAGAAAAVAWLLLAALAGRGAVLVALLVAFGAVVAALDALRLATLAQPWALLEPHWETWPVWLPEAVAAGLVVAAAGLGQWPTAGPAHPSLRRAPWVTAGIAGLLALLVATRAASATAASLGAVEPGPDVARWALAAAAAAVVVVRPGTSRERYARAAAGAAATSWFAGPAYDALPVWWGTLLPLGPAIVAGLLAAANTGAVRWACGAVAAALVLVALAGWPGLPKSPGPAAAVALVVVAAGWFAATRVVVRRAA